MLEAYEAYGDQFTMMELTKALVLDAARAVGRTVVPARDGGEIDLEGEWRQASILDLVSEAVGEEVTVETPTETLRKYAAAHDVELQPKWGVAGNSGRALRAARRGPSDQSDFRDGLPVGGEAAGQAAPQPAGRERGLGPDHQRRRAGAGVFGAQRPRRATPSARAAVTAGCAGRPGGDGARRGRSSRRWSTACRPRAGWEWAWTGSSCCSPGPVFGRRFFSRCFAPSETLDLT